MYSMNEPDRNVLYLLRWLEQRLPEVNPTPNNSLETIMYRAGQRSVVLELIKEFDPTDARHMVRGS